MLYDKEIDDTVLIQFIIVYTMNEVNISMSHEQLVNLVLDNCNISFVNFQLALANLVNTEHVREFFTSGNVQMYELLNLGREASQYSKNQVPIYIKEPIEKSIAPMFRAERLKNSIRAKLLPLNKKEYMANLSLYDDNTPLMELSFYAGTRAQANEIIKYFKEDPNKIYEGIMKTIVPPNSTNLPDE